MLQVEHPVTEATHPGLDIVQLMIQQGIAERIAMPCIGGLDPESPEMSQSTYSIRDNMEIHALEARVYCENPSDGFKPCPGLLQHVDIKAGDIDGRPRGFRRPP